MMIKVVIDGQTYQVDVEDIHARPVIAVIEGERYEVWPETDASAPASAPALKWQPRNRWLPAHRHPPNHRAPAAETP